jgi:hypothetical protein
MLDLKFSSGLGLGRAGLGLGLVVCGLDYNTVHYTPLMFSQHIENSSQISLINISHE